MKENCTLDKVGVNVSPDETTAWHVFTNKDTLQEMVTENLYKVAKGRRNAGKI